MLSRRSTGIVAAVILATAGAGSSGAELLEQRRARIEQMTPLEQKQLREDLHRFDRLPPEEQEQLRELHRALETHGNRAELERVMDAYCRWVSELPEIDRADLGRLSPHERIAKVAELQQQQQQRGSRGRLGGSFGHGFFAPKGGGGLAITQEDIEAVRKWCVRLVMDNRERLLEALPPEAREQWQAQFDRELAEERDEERAVWRMLIRWHLANEKQDLPVNQSDFAALPDVLSEKTRQQLETRSEEQRQQLFREMLRRIVGYQFVMQQREMPDLITPEELAEFFENRLEPGKRAMVMDRPNEETQWLLRLFYFQSKMPEIDWYMGDRRGPFFSRGGGGPSGSRGGPTGPPGSGSPGGEPRDRFGGPRPGGGPRTPDERPERRPPQL